MSTYDRVIKVLCEVLLWEENVITSSTDLASLDDSDYLEDETCLTESMAELLGYLEEEFDISLLNTDYHDQIDTVGDLIQLVEDVIHQ